VIVGKSEAIKRALALSEKFAPTALPILLVGATGTGKELFAQHIHRLSGRKGPLVDVNCGALPKEMAESLLFGHSRGAFTGAYQSTVGHVERASGGTLFLDEVTSLPHEAQVKLLRVLETWDVQPLGKGAKVHVDLRVVAAADEGIVVALRARGFRLDLYQRIAGVVIDLPPLAARGEDLVSLAVHFAGLQGQRLEPGVDEDLQGYGWPGNVRELRLVIERAGRLVEDGTISRAAVAEAIKMGVPRTAALVTRTLGRRRFDIELADLLAACETHVWKPGPIATSLGISRSTLFRQLKAHGISLVAGSLTSLRDRL